MEFDSVRFYNALVHSMSDAVIYADPQGRIQFWNSGAVRIFGFSEPEAIGRSLDIIIPGNLRQRHWAGFNETMRTGKSHYQAGALLAVPALRKDGSRISVEFTIVPFRHEAGGMLGIAAVMRDVTVRFEETKALRKQLAEAQKRLKDGLQISCRSANSGADGSAQGLTYKRKPKREKAFVSCGKCEDASPRANCRPASR